MFGIVFSWESDSRVHTYSPEKAKSKEMLKSKSMKEVCIMQFYIKTDQAMNGVRSIFEYCHVDFDESILLSNPKQYQNYSKRMYTSPERNNTKTVSYAKPLKNCLAFVEWVFSQCNIDLGRIIGTLKTYKPKDENNTYMYASQFRRDKKHLIHRNLRIMVTH